MSHPRMARERKTVELMIGLYCRNHHRSRSELCVACQKLVEYARLRLSRCPFQENKTTCGNCRIHCYKPELREKIREVMRYAGPRLIWHHPLLAMGHMLDGLRKNPGPRKNVEVRQGGTPEQP
ncbi:MAG: nitrous oxide-stimulated promoter family protein [Desulfobulbaceae bacterium]|nr:nitrous oxide-stimulated promoter family protein [Desulfobulbaceae bacterium]